MARPHQCCPDRIQAALALVWFLPASSVCDSSQLLLPTVMALLMLGTQLQSSLPPGWVSGEGRFTSHSSPSVRVGSLQRSYPILAAPFTSWRGLMVFVQLSCQLVGEVQRVSVIPSSFLSRQAAFPAGPCPRLLRKLPFPLSPSLPLSLRYPESRWVI